MSMSNLHLRLSSPALLVLLSAGCRADGAAPSEEAASPETFALEGNDAEAVHAPTGLGLRVGPLGATLDLHGVEIGFHTIAWGDAQGLDPLDTGDLELICETPEGCGRAVAVHHAGLSELWETHPRGFEQSWVVDAPRGDEDQLVVEIAVTGATLRQLPGQPAIWLDAGEGGHLQYDGLRVLDADGVELNAWMEVHDDRVRLIADVAGARWPVVMDPVVTAAAWMGVGESTWDTFGHALASGDFNGDTWPDLAVAATHNWGCPSDSTAGVGKVYVVYGSPDGLGEDASLPTSTVAAPTGAVCFAHKLASGDFDGDGTTDLAIGSPGDDRFRGAVYVHMGGPAGLSTTVSGRLTGTTDYDGFGESLSVGDLFGDGIDDLAIGADQWGSTTGATGAGYVRLYRGSTLALCRSVYGSTSGSRFGAQIALADLGADSAAELLVGAVAIGQVRRYTVTGCGSAPAYTTLSAPSGLRYFGTGMAVLRRGTASKADVVVSGETSDGTGRVYRYLLGSSSPSSSYLTDDDPGSQYGTVLQGVDLDLDGYTDLAVGARLADSDTGRVYVYDNSGGTLSLGSTLLGPAAGGHFGAALTRMDDAGHAGDSESLVVGAQMSSVDVGGSSRSTNGAAYVYTGY